MGSDAQEVVNVHGQRVFVVQIETPMRHYIGYSRVSVSAAYVGLAAIVCSRGGLN